MPVRLGDIAAFLGAKLEGDPGLMIEGVAELKSATPSSLSFLSNAKYGPQLLESKAGAVVLSPADAAKYPVPNRIVVANPYLDFARVTTQFFASRIHPLPGKHPLALVDAKADIGEGCCIGAFAVIEAGASIGERSIIYPFAYIGPNVKIGADCLIYARASVMEGSVLGKRVILQPGAVIGADGFGFAPNPQAGYLKIPQIGNAVLEDDVEVQANACVDRAALGSTIVGKGTKLDNLVQIAHNVKIGQHTVIAAQSAVSGSTVVGNWVTMAGQSATAGHLNIGDQVVITGQAGAGKDVPAKTYVSGSPAVPMLEHHRGLAEMIRLPEMRKRVKALEARLADLEKRQKP